MNRKIDLYWIYKIAFREWNELADDYNQWSELDKDEKLSLMSQILVNDYQFITSEASKILTGISETTWKDWEFASEGYFKYCEELPKTRKEMQKDYDNLDFPDHSFQYFRCDYSFLDKEDGEVE